MSTTLPWVFAGGDATTLGGTLVQAIAHGNQAALSIHNFLRGEKVESFFKPEPIEEISPHRARIIRKETRQKMPMRPVESRKKDFNEVELGFPEERAVKEARRCLNCAAGAVVDSALCAACLTCVRVCPYDVPEIPFGGKTASIGADCQSCGVCVVECPANAISLKDRYEDMGQKTLESLMNLGVSQHVPSIVCFLCQYDQHCQSLIRKLEKNGIKVAEVSCISKLEPLTLLRAFEMGANAVVILGCMSGDCHFDAGHTWARRRLDYTSQLLDTMGLDKQRLQWLSPTPEEEFSKSLSGFVEEIKKLGPVFQTVS
jgi:coenzyme F420-reducing hydrogenase delta subunit/NAD-dependent dihydropyrimidine dehydrogenase PreA subunit